MSNNTQFIKTAAAALPKRDRHGTGSMAYGVPVLTYNSGSVNSEVYGARKNGSEVQ